MNRKIVIQKHVFYRYEPNIKNGVLYIYDVKKEELIKSNEFTYNILTLIDAYGEEEKVLKELEAKYNDYKGTEIKKLVNQVLNFLENKQVLTYEKKIF